MGEDSRLPGSLADGFPVSRPAVLRPLPASRQSGEQKEETEKKEYLANVKNYKKGDPISIKLFAGDFLDIVNEIFISFYIFNPIMFKRIISSKY